MRVAGPVHRRLVLPEIAAIIEKKRNRTLRRGTLFATAFGLTGSPTEVGPLVLPVGDKGQLDDPGGLPAFRG